MAQTVQIKRKEENPFARSPTLDTVMMVEKTIEEHSGEYTKTQLWKSLPKKVMWQTYLSTIDYLEYSGKIHVDEERHAIWMWAPNEVEKLKRKNLVIK